MNKKIHLIRDMIYVTMWTLMVLLLYLYLSEIFLSTDRRNPFCILYICIICFADYWLRKYIHNAILFFLLRMLFLPAILLCTLDTIEIFLLVIVFLTFYTLGVTYWKSEASDKCLFAIDLPIEGIVLFIGIYFHASLDMSSGLANYAYLAGIAYFLFHFLRLYLDKYIQISLNLEDNPASLIPSFRMNSAFVILFISSVVLFIFIFNALFHNDSFNFVGTFLKFIASLFFGFLTRFDSDEVIPETEPVTTGSFTQGVETAPNTPYDNFNHTPGSNPVMDALFNIFQVVLYIGIVVVVLYSLYKFFKTYMYRNRETDDIIEKIDAVEKFSKQSKTTKPRNHIFLSNREKIRKIYRTSISGKLKHNRHIIIRKSNTPEEIKATLAHGMNCSRADLNYFTDIYEKARYSNHDITTEEVKDYRSLTPFDVSR